jgi:tetratricopeptide (TPR) repeat protein
VFIADATRAETAIVEGRERSATSARAALIEEGVELNFHGRLEEALEVWQELRLLAPNDPAAPVLETSTWYWYENFDDEHPGLEAKVIATSEEGIRKAEALLEIDEDNVEAHFYLGSALMNLGRMYGTSGRFYKAGTVGERGRDHLERVLELDPEYIDARYGLGIASFYASLIPDFVQWLSFLWFIPTGDAELGLSYLAEVEKNGRLNKQDAALILMNINTYHRGDYEFAWNLGGRLRARYPDNTVFQFEMIELAIARGDYKGAVAAARELESLEPRSPRDEGHVNVARVWRARAELAQGKPGVGLKTLEVFGEGEPATPSWGARWASLTRGQIYDVLGRRTEAEAEYQSVVDLGLSPLWSRATELAAEGKERPFTLSHAVSLGGE